VAHDLLFNHETDADWSMDPGSRAAAARAAALPLDFTKTERKTLKILEPSTAAFAVELVGWARQHGIPARISHTAVYTDEDVAENYRGGRSGIKPGRLSWHSVGRAFHLVIKKPDGALDTNAYAVVGRHAREQGGDWLGDVPVKTSRGTIYDTAHFEYHPGMDIGAYRKSTLAEREYEQAQRRARRYA
jgi:hypothetical protein